VPGIKLAPSILSADFSRLGEQVKEVAQAGADYIHIDVMDGHFVPNITIGPMVVSSVRKNTSLPLDVHLMISDPDRYLTDFKQAGANIITVHVEATRHLHRTVQTIKALGLRAGVSLNPATPRTSLDEILPFVDLVLVMTVNPGFGGQKFIPETLGKIKSLSNRIQKLRLNVEIEADGGIGPDNAREIVDAGANVLVAGASIFASKETPAEAFRLLREASVLNA
jgi:ribulose-phosphate 3-epimerase